MAPIKLWLNSVRRWQAALLLAAATAGTAHAQQGAVINIDETVTGNQEQPKVLYIVPWKTAAEGFDFEQSLSQQTTSGVFQHLERDELKRQLDYLQAQSKTQTTE
ncbi:hypothetical protein [Halioxenophilus aromaticivorans]|uniref:Uncharacterized protein n=1 Tax=Halioxenophilus aromaticivorans TaxID=1306992 RepID=A0AAV3U612_9ALTE